MSVLPPTAATRVSSRPELLENGDRMKAAEFERLYHLMPHVKKAELLRGIVYMPSPVRFDQHGEPHVDASGFLAFYKSLTRGVRSGDNSTVRLDDDHEPQPDLLLLIPQDAGGQSDISADGYVVGPPELTFEVASTSRNYDLGVKKDVYAEFGILEYIVWRVKQNAIDWFVLQNGQYLTLEPDADNIYRSTVFPGLWLDWQALLTGDLAKVFAVLQQGCSTPEHTEFVVRLQKK